MVLVANISKSKLEFAKFYETWKAERNRKALSNSLMVVGALMAVAVGAAVAATDTSKDDQIRDDPRSIQNKLDKM